MKFFFLLRRGELVGELLNYIVILRIYKLRTAKISEVEVLHKEEKLAEEIAGKRLKLEK